MLIDTAFRPGDIGQIAALHGRHYAAEWGFGTGFEAQVAAGLGTFALRQTGVDLALIARADGQCLGSLILDLHDPDSKERGAHLRWFILSAKARGAGLGRAMMVQAMDHVDRIADGRAWLTTFAGLDAARRLYEEFGFRLVREGTGERWLTPVTEQEFQRGRINKE